MNTFTVSDRAAERVAEIAAAQPQGTGGPVALRVAVLAGGCSGFQYKFELDEAPQPDDLVVQQGAARVLVDPASMDLLGGSVLDYTDALMGAHFTIRNPNATSACGCGTSFSVDWRNQVKIATWNVNSVRQRERHVAAWLDRNQPDLLLLQEIKCEEPQFPALSFPGYTAHVVGQKSYNGVAILARGPVTVNHRALPGLPEGDAQARYIEVEMAGVNLGKDVPSVTVGNLYLPNGNSGGEAGYAYKLAWMGLLAARAKALLDEDKDCVFAGDYNVAPTDEDYFPGTLPPNDALVRPETRAAYRAMLWLGLTDAVRALRPRGKVYTFWDYQAGAWRRDAGLRIDHALLSPRMAERLAAALPDRNERAQEQPSDHVPVVFEFAPA